MSFHYNFEINIKTLQTLMAVRAVPLSNLTFGGLTNIKIE